PPTPSRCSARRVPPLSPHGECRRPSSLPPARAPRASRVLPRPSCAEGRLPFRDRHHTPAALPCSPSCPQPYERAARPPVLRESLSQSSCFLSLPHTNAALAP